MNKIFIYASACVNEMTCSPCLVPRRLSFDENVRAKEGGKETTGETCRLYPSHGPLWFITSHSFRARLCHAKNEAPEEEAACSPVFFVFFPKYPKIDGNDNLASF